MSSGISPENEQFLQHVIACGTFQDRDQAIDAALGLVRKRQELLDRIDEGTRQLRSGQGIEIRGEDELRAFFEGIHAEGMQRREDFGFIRLKRTWNRCPQAPGFSEA